MKQDEGESFEAFRQRVQTKAQQFEQEYQPKLTDGIKIEIRLINTSEEDREDGDVDFEIKIAPNTTNVVNATNKTNSRPTQLQGKSTPILDRLEAQEPGVTVRYVYDFLNVYKGSRYAVPSDIVAYVEHRAARKIGMTGESDSINKYKAETGVSGLTKPLIDVYDSIRLTGDFRTRIPDIYKEDVVIGDVKNVKTLSKDAQMRDNIAIMEGKGKYHGNDNAIAKPPKRFDLVVRDSKDGTAESTYVSGPLREAVENSGGKIYEII